MQKSEILAVGFKKRRKKTDRLWYFDCREVELSDGTVTLIDAYKNNITPYRRYAIGSDNYYTYDCVNKKWGKATLVGLNYHTPSVVNYNDKYTASKRLVDKFGDSWVRAIQGRMEDIKSEHANINRQLSEIKAKETAAAIPDISDEFMSFVETDWNDSIIWTHKQNDRTFLTCSHCGYRDVITGELKKGKRLRCAYCGKVGTREEERDYRQIIEESTYYNDVRPYKNGVAIIAVEVRKTQQMALPVKYEYKQVAAKIFLPKRKTPDEYWIYDDNWVKGAAKNDDYNAYGCQRSKPFPTGPTPGYAKKILANSALKYTGWEYYGCELYKYLRYWQQEPKVELLAKAGLCRLITHILDNPLCHIILNMDAKSMHEVFDILPGREKLVIENKGNADTIRALQLESKTGKMKPETLKIVEENIRYYCELRDISKFVPLDKAVRYIATQTETRDNPISIYVDYLRMRHNLGYPMDERLYPRDLIEAHDEMVYQTNKKDRDKRARSYEKEYTNISKSYKKLSKKFNYERGDYLIRPAKNPTEIVEEGAILHHCVGSSSTYISSHNDGQSYILFLRKKQNPSRPFATIEISPDYEIKQWYEAYDRKPDKDVLQPYLDEYVNHLKEAI